MVQNDDQPRGRQDFSRNGQFEGDYERFETPETSRSSRPVSRSSESDSHKESKERHVTRLPGGRVLKGPRPIQRKNAQFWTEISDDVDALVEPIDASVREQKAATEDSAKDDERAVKRRPRRSTAARGRKAREKTAKPTSTGPKPSQRGFKWPTS